MESGAGSRVARTTYVIVRVTAEEKAAIQRAATRGGVSVSEMVRALADRIVPSVDPRQIEIPIA